MDDAEFLLTVTHGFNKKRIGISLATLAQSSIFNVFAAPSNAP